MSGRTPRFRISGKISAVVTANYALGPGIDLDGAVGYTWQDVSGPDFDDAADNYDALEIGIGTAITF